MISIGLNREIGLSAFGLGGVHQCPFGASLSKRFPGFQRGGGKKGSVVFVPEKHFSCVKMGIAVRMFFLMQPCSCDTREPNQ